MQQATLSAFVGTKDPQPPSPPQTTDHAKAVCWSLCYVRRLVRSHLPDDPLLGTLYAGQAVRVIGKKYPTAQAVAEARWKEEDKGSKHGDGSNLTFLEVLRVYGPEAFDNEVVWSTKGPRWEVQPLADAKEVALIAEHGGPVRDLAPDAPIKQTFNRQKGGKNLKNWYDGLMGAFSTKRWKVFQSELLKYIAEFGTTYVETAFVAKNMYRLGQVVSSVRNNGNYIDGHPDRRAWLNAQPGWTWNVIQSAEYRAKKGKESSDRWKSWTDAEKAEMVRKGNETKDAKTDAEKAETKRKQMDTMATEEFRAKRSKSATDAHASVRRAELERVCLIALPFEKSRKRCAEMRAASTDFSGRNGRAVLYMVSEDGLTIRRVNKRGEILERAIVGPVVDAKSDAEKAETKRKTKETNATDAFKAKKSKTATDQHASARRAELERARPIAVPFEKSRKRCVEMRAASTDFSGRNGNAVLYMVSEDGMTIRRVNKRGEILERDIVGPVVDPAPPDAFDSESD